MAPPTRDTGAIAPGLRVEADGADLIGGRCRSCRRHHFPRTSTCPWCGADATDEAVLSRNGTITGWTEVTVAPPGYHGPVPYLIGTVALPEGVEVVSRLIERTGDLDHGQAVHLTTTRLERGDGNELVVWSFETDESP
jgi:uncharacterized OB-fold protein